jgi:hypothetical protein
MRRTSSGRRSSMNRRARLIPREDDAVVRTSSPRSWGSGGSGGHRAEATRVRLNRRRAWSMKRSRSVPHGPAFQIDHGLVQKLAAHGATGSQAWRVARPTGRCVSSPGLLALADVLGPGRRPRWSAGFLRLEPAARSLSRRPRCPGLDRLLAAMREIASTTFSGRRCRRGSRCPGCSPSGSMSRGTAMSRRTWAHACVA